ncbi:MAG: hypothetical protein ABIZ81_16755 [Opitutaceae bacterium]
MATGTRIFLLVAMLGVSACASHFSAAASRKITPEQFVKLYHVDPLDQMHYVGSDASHHYFFRSRPVGSASLKIEKAAFRLPVEFPLSEGRKPFFLVGHFDVGTATWIQKDGFK